MTSMPDIKVFDNAALPGAAAQFIRAAAADAVSKRGMFVLALSGGTTPEPVLSLLAKESLFPWDKTYIFWADERFVPRTDAQNNYALARRTLLDKLPAMPAGIFPVQTELETPRQAALAYNKTLLEFERGHICGGVFFDLIFLGIGEDGHIASLFPGSAALEEKIALAAAITAPPGVTPRKRITLTPPALENSAHLLFLVSGFRKRAIMRAIAAGKPLPPLRLTPRGRSSIFCDRDALDGLLGG